MTYDKLRQFFRDKNKITISLKELCRISNASRGGVIFALKMLQKDKVINIDKNYKNGICDSSTYTYISDINVKHQKCIIKKTRIQYKKIMGKKYFFSKISKKWQPVEYQYQRTSMTKREYQQWQKDRKKVLNDN